MDSGMWSGGGRMKLGNKGVEFGKSDPMIYGYQKIILTTRLGHECFFYFFFKKQRRWRRDAAAVACEGPGFAAVAGAGAGA